MKLDQPSFAVLIDADGGTLKSIAPILTDISGFSASAVGWVMLDRRSGIPVRASGPVPVGH